MMQNSTPLTFHYYLDLFRVLCILFPREDDRWHYYFHISLAAKTLLKLLKTRRCIQRLNFELHDVRPLHNLPKIVNRGQILAKDI